MCIPSKERFWNGTQHLISVSATGILQERWTWPCRYRSGQEIFSSCQNRTVDFLEAPDTALRMLSINLGGEYARAYGLPRRLRGSRPESVPLGRISHLDSVCPR